MDEQRKEEKKNCFHCCMRLSIRQKKEKKKKTKKRSCVCSCFGGSCCCFSFSVLLFGFRVQKILQVQECVQCALFCSVRVVVVVGLYNFSKDKINFVEAALQNR